MSNTAPALLRYFSYEHLPQALQVASKDFHDLAHKVATMLPDGSERATALRKLLEGKDAAVRAANDVLQGGGTVTTKLSYEAAEIGAAKDIAQTALDDQLTHHGELDVIEAADIIVERLLDHGVIIPQTVTSPHRIGGN